ncbi:hypothetical protein Pan153_45380 [Gimesia panareensis]|uniref:Uncharacterized protein n=1 Tax=Gimesia panareensis TaxID=2527978 RepID=A0A518FU57_9PLAN|nr:prealbumin-like fold domain-containing protein [Gimesia panareensis]QDV19869.1 hypothetical protein Pan153_45380 [Gimesia panareensis]
MSWPEIRTDDFPPRRDDEPSSLRQEIIDELSDHFACALNRELLKNPDEQVARQRVLNQFGDPIKVARQLWLEAMKEKIMSQRILTGLSAVMAVCCIAVVGIAWSMMQESRAFNLQMLEQLKAEQAAQAKSSSQEMNPITFELIQEKEGGKPAVGFSGELAKLDDNGGKEVFKVKVTSDAEGRLEFGKLPWGKYKLKLHSPWREEFSTGILTTIPGRKYEQTIYCPAEAPGKVPVQFQINWSEKPAGEVDFLLCDFRHVRTSYPKLNRRFYLSTGRRVQHDTWTYQHNMNQEAERGVYLIDLQNDRATLCPLAKDGYFIDLELEKLDWQPTVEALQGDYFSPTVYLIREDELRALSELNSIDVFTTLTHNQEGFGVTAYGGPGQGMFVSPFEKLKLETLFQKELEIKNGNFRNQLFNAFSASKYLVHYDAVDPGTNVWKINIPALFPVTRESGSLSSVR